jgi:hypothetical protein
LTSQLPPSPLLQSQELCLSELFSLHPLEFKEELGEITTPMHVSLLDVVVCYAFCFYARWCRTCYALHAVVAVRVLLHLKHVATDFILRVDEAVL